MEVCGGVFLNLRTIVIFPAFENIVMINQIREKYDPLAKLIRPHITLVFPFDDEMSDEKLLDILNERLAGIKPFKIELQGFSKYEDSFGNYLFLNVIEGSGEIIKIHNLLYDNEFHKFDAGLAYLPHMTVGKFKDTFELERAYEEIKDMDYLFASNVDKIAVEMIGDNGESIIVTEKQLGQ